MTITSRNIYKVMRQASVLYHVTDFDFMENS